MTPQRIQLSRRKGFNLQRASLELNGLPAINCARPGHWGNVFKVGMPAPDGMRPITQLDSIEQCVEAHRRMCLTMTGKVTEIRTFLRGKNLACYCKLGDPCHVDFYLLVANKD